METTDSINKSTGERRPNRQLESWQIGLVDSTDGTDVVIAASCFKDERQALERASNSFPRHSHDALSVTIIPPESVGRPYISEYRLSGEIQVAWIDNAMNGLLEIFPEEFLTMEEAMKFTRDRERRGCPSHDLVLLDADGHQTTVDIRKAAYPR